MIYSLLLFFCFILFIYYFIYLFYLLFYLFIIYFKFSINCGYRLYFDDPITRIAQKNVIEEKLLEIKRSIRRGIYLFQIHSGHFSR